MALRGVKRSGPKFSQLVKSATKENQQQLQGHGGSGIKKPPAADQVQEEIFEEAGVYSDDEDSLEEEDEDELYVRLYLICVHVYIHVKLLHDVV